MALQYERSFIQHCTLPDSLSAIVEIGLPPEVFADDALRRIYIFALDYFHDDARSGAPSGAALKVHFANELAEHEIDVDFDPEDALEWCIEALRGARIDRVWQGWVRDFATEMSEADILDKPEKLVQGIGLLMELHTSLVRQTEQVDLRSGMVARLREYDARETDRLDGGFRGIRLGLSLVDQHTHGIWPGELGILAGGPKSGKSFALAHSALAHWRAGGTPTIMTLENSVEMTEDRIAVMELGLDARRFSRGEMTDSEKIRIREWVNDTLKAKDHPLWIIQPEPGRRTAEHMVRQAKIMGDALYIDQLTFMDPSPRTNSREPYRIQIRDTLHDLKALIGHGSRISCLLAHQISRDGVKAAEKSGKLEMYHMAEAAEVERTADWVFGLWQGAGLRQMGAAYFQLLAARREDLADWQLTWLPWIGRVAVGGLIDLRGAT